MKCYVKEVDKIFNVDRSPCEKKILYSSQSVTLFRFITRTHTQTHTHTNIHTQTRIYIDMYIYIYIKLEIMRK